jgi:hypothetical protein
MPVSNEDLIPNSSFGNDAENLEWVGEEDMDTIDGTALPTTHLDTTMNDKVPDRYNELNVHRERSRHIGTYH